MDNFKLATLKKPQVDYHEFTKYNQCSSEKNKILVTLNEMNAFYTKHGIIDSACSEKNTSFTGIYTVDWAFEVYMMKKAILNRKEYKIGSSAQPALTRQANQVLLLAMVYSRSDIVQIFLQNKLVNINQSIFGSRAWPSYFILACACTDEIFSLFKGFKIRYDIGWNGLTPYLISSYKSRKLPKNGFLDFITYKQYAMLHRYRNVELRNSPEQIPIFPLDFACMNRDRALIKEILDAVPEAGSLSRLSFIVQNEENLFLILSKYDFREEQTFNGETPLHYSCYSGDLCALSILLNLGFPILQNYQMKWPHEVGSLKTKEKSTVFFNLCTADANDIGRTARKVFNQSNFEEKMTQWMEILKFNPKDYDKYRGIFRYIKFNRSHKIMTNSRFNIVNLFTMSKTPVEVEQFIKRMAQFPFYENEYTEDKTAELYRKIYR